MCLSKPAWDEKWKLPFASIKGHARHRDCRNGHAPYQRMVAVDLSLVLVAAITSTCVPASLMLTRRFEATSRRTGTGVGVSASAADAPFASASCREQPISFA